MRSSTLDHPLEWVRNGERRTRGFMLKGPEGPYQRIRTGGSIPEDPHTGGPYRRIHTEESTLEPPERPVDRVSIRKVSKQPRKALRKLVIKLKRPTDEAREKSRTQRVLHKVHKVHRYCAGEMTRCMNVDQNFY